MFYVCACAHSEINRGYYPPNGNGPAINRLICVKNASYKVVIWWQDTEIQDDTKLDKAHENAKKRIDKIKEKIINEDDYDKWLIIIGIAKKARDTEPQEYLPVKEIDFEYSD